MNANYTLHAREALDGAQAAAQHFNHSYVGAEHILLAVLSIPGCSARNRLLNLQLDPDDLRIAVEQMIGTGEPVRMRGELPVTSRTKKILELALLEAKSANSESVSTTHIILAMLQEGESVGAQVLLNRGVTPENFMESSDREPEEDDDGIQDGDFEEPQGDDEGENEDNPNARNKPQEQGKKVKTPALNAYGRDLTALAAQGRLDPVIGRHQELERIIQVLCRRTKNNAVLIGEAGVGKTAVVEGLAQAIASGDVPELMSSKRVVALDMTRVVAGTQYRGQFEERLKQIIEETRHAGNVVLFLDEIHTLVGAGGPEGAMDAANILKPALARGELQCVGATTMKEYRKSIEKDAALERRFQSIVVNEPSPEEAFGILKGIAPRYEEHHHVKFSDEALRAAVDLTARYQPARLLPDKAIDAIDETGARVRMRASVRPPELKAAQDRAAAEKRAKEEAIEKQDFENAAMHRDAEIQARSDAENLLAAWQSGQNVKSIAVTYDDVASTVASICGVPVQRVTQTSAKKLLGIEKELNGVVIGQSKAIEAVARSLRRSRAELQDPRRPIGSFLFLGPTGVGKTLLAEMLAEKIYGDSKALIAIDMSEYTEKYSASRLVGSPPGYVGYEEGGQLTERVRRRPYSVVLFDEFEKADTEVMNMLLQILDEGRLTDGQGRTVDFRNTIVICTANLGFDFAKEGRGLGFAPTTAKDSYETLREKLMSEAKRTFRPELLNRFDETVVFGKLDRKAVETVLDIELAKLRRRLSAKDITLELASSAVDFLVSKGYDDAMGARPLKRAVRRYVEDPLAEGLLSEKLKPGKVRGKISRTKDALEFSQDRRYSHSVASSESEEMS